MRARIALAWLVACAGCGSSTQILGGGDGGADGASASGACPASAPQAGSSCSTPIACEYGGDPDVACNTVATCSGGSWSVKSTKGTPCSTATGMSCPATFAALGSTCSPVGMQCIYPEARCTCDTHCDRVGMQNPFWCCPDGPSGVSGCPSPRPRIGTSCTTPAMVCDYGGCTGNVTLKCSGGTWQPTMIACPG